MIQILNKLKRPKVSPVYRTYWKFATKRQDVFFKRFRHEDSPWTNDPVLLKHKFTNAYRASDRVSQYLINEVIYKGDQNVNEMFFRTILFKLFNKIDTWELLSSELGNISWKNYSFKKYNQVLTDAIDSGESIYSGAYIMASGGSYFGFKRKHENHLKLLEKMLKESLPHRISELGSMEKVFNALKEYPTIGNFLAYQYSIDINYSTITSFSEMDFVYPGPGALDGIAKCFSDFGDFTETDLIKLVTDQQETEFEKLDLKFQNLWGRPLQLIDCQNLFCEVDKYARVAHPEIEGLSNRKRIKQLFNPKSESILYSYPPKWAINEKIKNTYGKREKRIHQPL